MAFFEEGLFFIYLSSPIFLLISKKLVSRLNEQTGEQTGKTIISSQKLSRVQQKFILHIQTFFYKNRFIRITRLKFSKF